MTQAEKIKMLEAELKAERLEHEKAEAEIKEYEKREEKFVFVEQGSTVFSGFGYSQTFTVRTHSARYGSGMFDYRGFCNALTQFLNKWNEAAREACVENEFKKQKKGGRK